MTSLLSLKVLLAITLVLYVGTYVSFRQSSTEIWERDKQAYVIFPADYGGALTISGGRFHMSMAA